MIHFAFLPALWLLFLPIVIYVLWPKATQLHGDALKVPFVSDIENIQKNVKRTVSYSVQGGGRFFKILPALMMWLCVVAALCRPQIIGEPKRVQNESREILLVVDISTSMNERDFVYRNKVYDRLTAVKNVVSAFVDERVEDKIGLVLFGTQAYMQVPPTYDRQALKDVLWSMDAGMAGNSTSIGDAIGVALKNMIADTSDSQNKLIVLMTDGENNDGSLSLPQAIMLAKQENIKVYTIGVGSDVKPIFGGIFSLPVDSGLDEESLKVLAQETQGTYFRAKDVDSLQKIYREIDRLEPQQNEGRYVQETKEIFYYPAFAALLFFMVLMFMARKAI